MKLRHLFFIAALGLPSIPVLALNFMPRPETQIIDDYTINYFSFEDGDRRVEYGPPNGWKCTGSPTKLTLEDPQNRQGLAVFTAIPVPKPSPFSAENLKTFKAVVQSLLPAESQNVTITEATGQHTIGNREFYTANLGYVFYGQKFLVRVTFINLDKNWLQIVCSAPTSQFEAFSKNLDSSLCSWNWK